MQAGVQQRTEECRSIHDQQRCHILQHLRFNPFETNAPSSCTYFEPQFRQHPGHCAALQAK